MAVPSVRHHDRGGEQIVFITSSAGSSPGKAFTPRPGISGPGARGREIGQRRLRDGVEGFRSPSSRRKCLIEARERVKGEKTVSPFTIPAVPQRNRCCALRSPPGPQPAVGSTRPYSSHPWDSPLRGQRKRCSKLLQAILSCLDSPLSAIPGGQPLSSVLRFADFSGGQGIAA